jgi:hypothetical protein
MNVLPIVHRGAAFYAPALPYYEYSSGFDIAITIMIRTSYPSFVTTGKEKQLSRS